MGQSHPRVSKRCTYVWSAVKSIIWNKKRCDAKRPRQQEQRVHASGIPIRSMVYRPSSFLSFVRVYRTSLSDILPTDNGYTYLVNVHDSDVINNLQL